MCPIQENNRLAYRVILLLNKERENEMVKMQEWVERKNKEESLCTRGLEWLGPWGYLSIIQSNI